MGITRFPFAGILLSGFILTLSACGGQPLTFNANPVTTSSVATVSSEESSSEISDSSIAHSSSSTVTTSSAISSTSTSTSSTIVVSSSSSSKSSSSSSRSSSSSSAASSLSGPTGAQLYVSLSCAACHGTDGSGGIVGVSLRGCASCTNSSLASRITTTMPQGAIGTCDATCGTKIAQYILGGFVTSSNQTTQLLKQSAASELISTNSLLANSNSNCTIAYSANDLRPLTRKEYASAILQITGVDLINDLGQDSYDALPLDNITTQLYNNVEITLDNNTQQAYNLAATKISEQLYLRNFNGVATCNTEECFNQIIDNVGCKIFRRPLTTEERTNYLFFYNSTISNGIQKVLGLMLASPNFIYRSDIGLAMIDNNQYSANPANTQPLLQTPKTMYIYEKDVLNAVFTGNDVLEITVKSNQGITGLWPTLRVQVGSSTFVDLLANQSDITTYRFHISNLSGNNNITIINQQTGAPLEYQAGHNLIISSIKLSSVN